MRNDLLKELGEIRIFDIARNNCYFAGWICDHPPQTTDSWGRMSQDFITATADWIEGLDA